MKSISGLTPGGQLDVETTLCIESKRSLEPIVIEHASQGRAILQCATPNLYIRSKSYISVPIVLKDGRYFLAIYAPSILPPAKIGDPKILDMFKRHRSVNHLATALKPSSSMKGFKAALRDAEATNELQRTVHCNSRPRFAQSTLQAFASTPENFWN